MGARSQASALFVVPEVRWPQEVTLTSLMSQPTLSGHHIPVNAPSCLSGLWFAFTEERERQKLRRTAKAGLYASEFLCCLHWDSCSSTTRRKASSKIHRPFKKQGLGRCLDFECPEPKCTGRTYASTGRRKKESKSSYVFGFRVLSLIIFSGTEDGFLAIRGKEKQIPLTNVLPRCSPGPNIFLPFDLTK